MATGRTVARWTRVYVDGYDMSGVGRAIGPLDEVFDEEETTAFLDTVKTYLPNTPNVTVGTLNALFDNTVTTGIHTVMQSSGVKRTVLVAKGIRAAPAAGDPAFGGQFLQSAYHVVGEGGVFVNIPFSGWAQDATHSRYPSAWGQLLHALSAETGANAAVGFDDYTGAATTKGGYLIYHITASNAAGTATISVDDSATNLNDAAFAALSGATSGAIGFASIPAHGIVAIANTATVRQYLRWQLALAGGMTTCTFTAAFMRAY